MKKAEKTAICRVFHDLIKADTIIDAGEMRCYVLMKEKYGISKDSVSSTAAFVSIESRIENTPNNKYHNGTKTSLHRLD